ncbi:hypothetical protein K0M31_013907 [Melipona bicolor]|uniref:Uncharacterized protein n=1 Tax=Melipona bicolor TaxID=60889 RepID=A0AA40KTV3_9HYME|nr:hypothetical protein K0M31_013907 [Melipona bicolor]
MPDIPVDLDGYDDKSRNCLFDGRRRGEGAISWRNNDGFAWPAKEFWGHKPLPFRRFEQTNNVVGVAAGIGRVGGCQSSCRHSFADGGKINFVELFTSCPFDGHKHSVDQGPIKDQRCVLFSVISKE